MSCDTKKFHDNESTHILHNFWTSTHRGKLPSPPPWRRHCPTHSFVSGQVKRHSTPSLAHLINTSHRPRTLRAVEFLYDVRRLFQRRIPLTESRVSHCRRCDFCQSVRGCRQDATQRTRGGNKRTHTHTHTRTHTHIHTFNGPFSGTTRVRRYQKGKTNLDFTEARDSEWQWF